MFALFSNNKVSSSHSTFFHLLLTFLPAQCWWSCQNNVIYNRLTSHPIFYKNHFIRHLSCVLTCWPTRTGNRKSPLQNYHFRLLNASNIPYYTIQFCAILYSTHSGYARFIHQNCKVCQVITLTRDSSILSWCKPTPIFGPATTIRISEEQIVK